MGFRGFLTQNSATYPLIFTMFDSLDGKTPKTGLSPTVTLSKNGGSFSAPAGAVSESPASSGQYKVAANSADTNTLGMLTLKATATGADTVIDSWVITPYDPFAAELATQASVNTVINSLALVLESPVHVAMSMVPRETAIAWPFVLVDADTRLPVGAVPTGGTFTLEFGGSTTAPIAYNATASQVADAIILAASLTGVDPLVGTGGPLPGTVSLEWQNDYAGQNTPLLQLANNSLTGGLSLGAVIATSQNGSTTWTNRIDRINGANGADGGTFDITVTQGGTPYTASSIPYNASPSDVALAINSVVSASVASGGGGTLPLGEEVTIEWIGTWAGAGSPTAFSISSNVTNGTYTQGSTTDATSTSVNEIQTIELETTAAPTALYVRNDTTELASAGTVTILDSDTGLWLANLSSDVTANQYAMVVISATDCIPQYLWLRTTRQLVDSSTVNAYSHGGQALATYADVSVLQTRLSEARAGYLDKLNISGNVASSTEVTSIQNNTRAVRVVPPQMPRPASGGSSIAYRVEILLYDETGGMEAPDSAPTISVINAAGTSRNSNLDSTTMTLVSTGRYRSTYTVADSHAAEELIFVFSVTENSATRSYANSAVIVDAVTVDFTASDRSKLESVYNKLPAGNLVDAADVPTATENADALLARSYSFVEATAAKHSLAALIALSTSADRTTNPGYVTSFRTDGTTEMHQYAIVTAEDLDGVSEIG